VAARLRREIVTTLLCELILVLWLVRLKSGPVAPTRAAVADPAAMAESIKSKPRELGAGIVGVTRV
jgi:hypothetical protein